MGLTLRYDRWIMGSVISRRAVDGINILWCELIGSEPEGSRGAGCWARHVRTRCLGARARVCAITGSTCTCDPAVHSRAFLEARVSVSEKRSQTQPNKLSDKVDFHFQIKFAPMKLHIPLEIQSISALERGGRGKYKKKRGLSGLRFSPATSMILDEFLNAV